MPVFETSLFSDSMTNRELVTCLCTGTRMQCACCMSGCICSKYMLEPTSISYRSLSILDSMLSCIQYAPYLLSSTSTRGEDAYPARNRGTFPDSIAQNASRESTQNECVQKCIVCGSEQRCVVGVLCMCKCVRCWHWCWHWCCLKPMEVCVLAFVGSCATPTLVSGSV